MIVKTYIGDPSDVRYEVSNAFTDVRFINCSDLTLHSFIKLHQPSLFDNSIKVFLNVDQIPDKSEELINYIPNIKTKVIWTFSSLAKNRKIYKKLASCSNISECNSLKSSTKKDFIKAKLTEKQLPLKFLNLFLVDGAEDRSILSSEINKFATLHSVTKDQTLLEKSVCKFNGSLDTLDFVSKLLEGDIAPAYKYALKLSNEVHASVISAVILKKLRAMIYLSIGDVNTANTIWRHGNYFLDLALRQSKKVGFLKLINLYDYVYVSLGDPLNDKDVMVRLSELIQYTSKMLDNH